MSRINPVDHSIPVLDDEGRLTNVSLFNEKSHQVVLVIDSSSVDLEYEQSLVAPDGLMSDMPMCYWISSDYERHCAQSSARWQATKDAGDKISLKEGGGIHWANDGYCTLEASTDLYAAALMCTSAESVGFKDIHFPSLSIVFRVPHGLIDVDHIRLDIADFGNVSLYACRCSGPRFIGMYSDTVDDLLFTPLEEAEVSTITGGTMAPYKDGTIIRNATAEERRMFIMVRHYVAGLLIAYQAKSNWTYEGLKLAQAKRVRNIPPQHRRFFLGRDVRADVREGVKHYVNGTRHKSPAFQFVVRGHYRNQPYGPKQASRRIQWIEPFWKPGKNPDAPILARSVLL
jgi:hypothetical protein